ncbi:unnamed protein product, partial [Linum tenue]
PTKEAARGLLLPHHAGPESPQVPGERGFLRELAGKKSDECMAGSRGGSCVGQVGGARVRRPDVGRGQSLGSSSSPWLSS